MTKVGKGGKKAEMGEERLTKEQRKSIKGDKGHGWTKVNQGRQWPTKQVVCGQEGTRADN